MLAQFNDAFTIGENKIESKNRSTSTVYNRSTLKME